MSFLLHKYTHSNEIENSNKFYKRNTEDCIKLQRKEKDSFFARQFKNISQSFVERTSVFTSQKHGTITLEATFAVCFFFFGAITLIYLLEIMAMQTTIRNALHAVGKEVAVEMCVKPMIPTTQMEQEIVELIGNERLERSIIVGGSSGIDCSNSKKYWNTTIMDLSVSYQMEIPILMFRLPLISREEVIRIKGWTGHETKQTDAIENEMVYVTDYGIVYHKDMSCTYLELSIKMVNIDEVVDLRNQSGGIYKACVSCRGQANGKQQVYITDYGDCYHNSLDCKGLKRSVYAVSITDIHGLGGCSKCVK